MNILIVSQYFWPENFRINDLAVGLAERGHNVSVLTGIPNYPGGRFYEGYGLFRNRKQEYKGVRIIRVPLLSRGKSAGVRLALNYFSYAFFACIRAAFFWRRQIDVVFVFEPSPITVGLPALVLKKLWSTPILFWVLDLWPESLSATGAVRSPTILNIVGKLVCYIYRHCEKILIQSPAFSGYIENQGVDPERIGFFPNSVEPLYKPATSQPSLEINKMLPAGFKIMFAGNIGEAQDFGTILSAAEILTQYPDIHIVVLGNGRRFEWVKEEIQARNLSDTVHLLGRHSLESMPDFFAVADGMLVTLKRDPIFALTIPAKIQSYMACEKPIIAALDGEGSRLIKESGAGLVSPAGDSEALAGVILELYGMNSEEREAMGRRGKRYCDKNFEREMLLGRLEGWMKDAVALN